MGFAINLILVDSDIRRRATITHALSDSDIHVEPFESLAELTVCWPRSGTILIHDKDDAIARLITAMSEHGEWYPAVAFSEEPDAGKIVEAVLAGAIDYIAWPIAGSELTAALDRALERADRIANAKLREAKARSRIEKLTRREREVLNGVADGLSNRLIGERLQISPRTVEIHRANMLNKLGANHTSEAIRIAIEADVVN